MTKKTNLLRRLRKDESGSIGPLFGLLSMPMFFVIGMSIDYARTIGVENSVQNALDAAALAAMATEATDVDAIGQQYFAANMSNTNYQDPIVHFTKLDDGSVRATASVSVPTIASGILGVNTLQVETYSVVEPPHEVATTSETTTTSSNLPCLHVMDQSGAGTMSMTTNQHVDARNCVVKVRSNSNSAVSGSGNSDVKFKRIKVKGGGSLGGASTNKADGGLDTDSAIVSNPYESSIRDVVQAVSIGNCTNTNTGTTSSPKVYTGSVSPGTYCGSTTFNNATFQSGLYIVKSGNGNGKDGALRFTGTIDGSAGVTFYLADNKTQMKSYAATSGSVLKAPTTGTTRGVLIMEDSNRGSTWSLSINASDDAEWQGLVYLPSVNLTMDTDDWDMEVSMAVNQLILSGTTDLAWNAYSWTPFNSTTPITLGSDDDDITTTTTSSTGTTDIFLRE